MLQYERLALKWNSLQKKDFWYRRRIAEILHLTPDEKHARGITRTVRLIANFPGLWQRTIEQTRAGRCQWGATLFVAEGRADYYFVLNAPSRNGNFPNELQPRPPRERTFGLHMEPDEYIALLGYDRTDNEQNFSRFYTNSERLLAEGGIYRESPPYVHFHIGKSWDYLSAATSRAKKIEVGVISSSLNDLEGHRQRLTFLGELDRSGIDYALWGRGQDLQQFRNYRGFVASKWAAHSICRYTIVIENSVSKLYWSEKPADALLAFSFPLYHGSPNLSSYLPVGSFAPIDIGDRSAMDHVRALLASGAADAALPAIMAARQKLLREQNLYAFIDRELASIER